MSKKSFVVAFVNHHISIWKNFIIVNSFKDSFFKYMYIIWLTNERQLTQSVKIIFRLKKIIMHVYFKWSFFLPKDGGVGKFDLCLFSVDNTSYQVSFSMFHVCFNVYYDGKVNKWAKFMLDIHVRVIICIGKLKVCKSYLIKKLLWNMYIGYKNCFRGFDVYIGILFSFFFTKIKEIAKSEDTEQAFI